MFFILFLCSSQPRSLFESSWLSMSTCGRLLPLLESKHHGTPGGQGQQWLFCFLKFLQNMLSAWYLTEALKTFEWIHAAPGACRLSSQRALVLQRIMFLALSAHHSCRIRAFCSRQMGKERFALEAWETFANKPPKWAVNSLRTAKETRYAAYLPEGQSGG